MTKFNLSEKMMKSILFIFGFLIIPVTINYSNLFTFGESLLYFLPFSMVLGFMFIHTIKWGDTLAGKELK